MDIQNYNKQIKIASIILAGGKGTRLHPLTLNHSKPAISYGGRYRLIDIPISNSLNSNIRQIYVIGQYLTSELHHHLAQTYQFDNFFPGSLDLITPEELPSGEKIWFEGTADAIRKNKDKLLNSNYDYFLILSGDQLYNINFYEMLSFAIKKDADLTIASLPVSQKEATRMGILKTNKQCYITDFIEKPKKKELLDKFKLPLSKNKKQFLGSMGIYIFKKEALENLLNEEGDDFGKNLIPIQVKKGKTAAFVYNGYWEDIGTIESYYKANIALTHIPSKGLKTYDEKNPIYTGIHHLPGTKIENTKLHDSIICEGGVIQADEIINSVIGLRSYIKQGTKIYDSIIMGSNSYSYLQDKKMNKSFGIGKDCLLKKVIIDEHVKIGNNVKITNKNKLKSYEDKFLCVKDGIVVITADTVIPNNYEF